jgi:signal transduction histidine kinase
MIGDIHKSSMRLISIVNDFLDTSRLELGKMEFKKEKVSMEGLIDEILKEFTTTGSMKKLYLEAEKSKTKIPSVLADRDRTRQILINLIGNAIKFTEKGGIKIKIEPEKTSVKVLVADTGKGISPESQNLLFRKFQQATESIFTRDAINGTGLGLYISRMMAEGMGGEVRLESSAVGKGSVFSLTLPVAGNTIKNTES